MNEKNSNSNSNNKMIDIAIMSGCKTIKDFAIFLKEHTPKIETLEVLSSEQEMTQLSLLR
jgi:hypothetical protein